MYRAISNMHSLETGLIKSKTYCVTTMYNVGCTFLDWSIMYLSNQTHYFQIQQNQVLQLPNDPLTSANAHGYKKNHPHGLKNLKHAIEILELQSSCKLTSVYPGPPHLDTIAVEHNIPIDTSLKSNMYSLLHHQRSEYHAMIEYCFDKSIPVVYVAVDPSFAIFMLLPRSKDRLTWENRSASSDTEAQSELHRLLYNDQDQYWKDQNLINIWDQRERLALDLRPFDMSHPQNTNGFSRPHCWIDSRDLWYRGETVIHNIMDFLNLPINADRLESWILIYHKWRTLANKNIEFSVNLDHIVNSIVMGWYYPLPDLDLYQEAVIQHCLIYQHNLNIKTWQLSKFPNNTQLLHDLLEPNTHRLS